MFKSKIQYFKTAILGLLLVLAVSCDKDDVVDDDVVGSWYGTRTYYEGQKKQYLSVDFNSDKTGKLEYETPVSYGLAYFTYSVSGNKITCKGAYANTYGDVEESFSLSFLKQGDRLYPQEKYSEFILTRDGSVIVDSYGEEVVDKSDLLQNVWVAKDGYTVLRFYDDTYDEYVLDSPFSSSYSSLKSGTYSYSPVGKYLIINTTKFDITTLDNSNLIIKNSSTGKSLAYQMGSESDIPTKINASSLIIGNTWSDKNSIYTLTLTKEGKVVNIARRVPLVARRWYRYRTLSDFSVAHRWYRTLHHLGGCMSSTVCSTIMVPPVALLWYRARDRQIEKPF